ncbi:DNA polymerase beta-like domain [Nitrosomonas europaea ATCC 19718]|uniref:DNA polymerase beta-like domain n=2 Tax=Nitrosomonadaceae TaxID=206379 RepID=Q82UF5_NITEU|nr:DNA polymerase beta-like domain [Nitrosomonas europaea ATCC 19718]
MRLKYCVRDAMMSRPDAEENPRGGVGSAGFRRKHMNRDRVLAVLRHSKPMLASRYGVRRLALFGSTARDDSDVDVLMVFDGVASAARYFGVQFHLEDALGCSVDLVSEKALRPELRPFIEKEAVYV